MSRIADVALARREAPLRRPYVLSFATLPAFELLEAAVRLEDGRLLRGEVVPLPGYLPEGPADVLHRAGAWRHELVGLAPAAARARIAPRATTHPVSASLLLSALDAGWPAGAPPGPRRVPLVRGLSAGQPDLAAAATAAAAEGFQTVKVKVGRGEADDLAAVDTLAATAPPSLRLRFDANQAWDEATAGRFLTRVEEQLAEQVELVEQPLPPEDWAGMARLARAHAVPLMLDESVRGADDVVRAAGVGAAWIKLKLCKQGGVEEVLSLAETAVARGLRVVLGNGVAGEVSNLLELCLVDRRPDLFHGAAEANGFARLAQRARLPTLRLAGGCAVWDAAAERGLAERPGGRGTKRSSPGKSAAESGRDL